MGILTEIGKRLKEERIGLSKSVALLSHQSGASRGSIENYESGKTPINVAMLLVLQDLGFDIGYVITGVRGNREMGFGDAELLRLYGMLSRRERDGVMALIYNLTGETVSIPDTPPKSPSTLHGQMPSYTPPPEDL